MKVAVFGGTGPTGALFIDQALAQGHQVIAIVRNPSKVKTNHTNLQVVVANIFSAEELVPHLTSCEAVVSCLGSGMSLCKEITIYSESAKSITSAMTRANIKRLIVISSWFVEGKSDHPYIVRYFFKPLLRKFFGDMQRMERFLEEECPAIEFTAVRAPGLNNKRLDPKETLMEPDIDYSTTMDMMALPRANLAQCLVNILENNLHQRRFIAVGLLK